jgi:hypothetical protein
MNSKLNLRIMRLGLLFALSTFNTLCLADSVVVASTASDYAAGQVIAAGQGIELAEGESVRLLTGSGRTLTVRGPHSGAVEEGGDAAGKDVTRVLTTLLSGPAQDTSTLGATRAISPLASEVAVTEESPGADPVRVDVTRSGKYCVRSGARVLIPRPSGSREDRLSLTNQATGSTETLVWGSSAQAIEWPVSLPAQGDLQVLARLGMLGGPVRLTFIPLALESDDPGAMAVHLIELGCRTQAQPYLRQLAAQPLAE